MRIQFATQDRPKNLAKSLRHEMAELGRKITHGEALKLTSLIYGYQDWQQLCSITGTAPASDDDDFCHPSIVASRYRHQLDVLQSAGLPQSQAAWILEKTHPTNVKPRLEVEWTDHEGGKMAVEGGSVHWVGPAPTDPDAWPLRSRGLGFGPAPKFVIRDGCIADGKVEFYNFMSPRAVDGIEAGIAAIEERIRRCRVHDREVRRFGRYEYSLADSRLTDAPWGRSTERVRVIGEGLLEVQCDRHGGFRVSAALVASMPEVLRQTISEDGYAWYEEDCEASLVRVGLPQFFTSVEREGALASISNNYTGIFDILIGRTPPTEENLIKAKRGFTGEKIEWDFPIPVDEDQDSAGRIRVQATMSSYWGSNPPEKDEMLRPRTFLVSATEYQAAIEEVGFFCLDPDRHPMIEDPERVPDVRPH